MFLGFDLRLGLDVLIMFVKLVYDLGLGADHDEHVVRCALGIWELNKVNMVSALSFVRCADSYELCVIMLTEARE